MLPEWAPNWHPLIVHFPLALLVVAVGADSVALMKRRWTWLRPMVLALYVAGAVSAIATYFTGTWAADSVGALPAAAESVLSTHADWGWWTMWFFGVYAIARVGAWRIGVARDRRGGEGAFFAVALVGLVLLWQAGEHGAQLVYRHGVGVALAANESESAAPAPTGFQRTRTGWTWQPASAVAWTKQVQWMGNPSSSLKTKMVPMTEEGGQALQLRLAEGPLLFVVPDTLGSVQVTVRIHTEAFDGAVMLVHHVQGDQTYDFLALSEGRIQIGRMNRGTRSVLDEALVEASGWLTLRVTGDGTHFRGYLGDQVVVHAHGEALAPGPVGIRLDGQGRLKLRHLRAQEIAE